MKKQIVMSEEEYDSLLVNFAAKLREDWGKDYGYKVISRETGEEIKELDHLAGALLMPWNKIFK